MSGVQANVRGGSTRLRKKILKFVGIKNCELIDLLLFYELLNSFYGIYFTIMQFGPGGLKRNLIIIKENNAYLTNLREWSLFSQNR